MCSKWLWSYSRAFPELSMTEGIPRSAPFHEILEVLRVYGELEPEGEIELVGLSMPIRRSTLLVIAIGIVTLQCYLLLAIMMAVQAVPELLDRQRVPWIALFVGTCIPNYIWYMSLFVPVLSIIALIISVSIFAASGSPVIDITNGVVLVFSLCLALATERSWNLMVRKLI